MKNVMIWKSNSGKNLPTNQAFRLVLLRYIQPKQNIESIIQIFLDCNKITMFLSREHLLDLPLHLDKKRSDTFGLSFS